MALLVSRLEPASIDTSDPPLALPPVIEIPLDVDVDDSPLPMKTEPLDTPRVEPLEIDTLPLALVLADTDAIFTSDNPSIVKDPPEPAIDALDALDVDPSAADNSKDPPVVPLPAEIDTDPPVAALEPADKLMSPDEPFVASPVNNDNDPLDEPDDCDDNVDVVSDVRSNTDPLDPVSLDPPDNNKDPPVPATDDPPVNDAAPPDEDPAVTSPPDKDIDPPRATPSADIPAFIEIDPPDTDEPAPSPVIPASIVTDPPPPPVPAPLRISTEPPIVP